MLHLGGRKTERNDNVYVATHSSGSLDLMDHCAAVLTAAGRGRSMVISSRNCKSCVTTSRRSGGLHRLDN